MMHLRLIYVIAAALLLATGNLCRAQEIVDTWRYTLSKPADGWRNPDFDASDWTEASGGFGTRDTPGARIGTTWETDNIWIRKSFELSTVPAKPALWMHHDEDVEVYVNGKILAQLDGFTNKYELVAIPEANRDALKSGTNVMAAHCRQTLGGQFVDVHLVDAENVPNLPPAKRDTKPFQSELITIWGAEVNAKNAWTEYPRPQLQRKDWMNLNGNWDYAISSVEQSEAPKAWDGKILVPYCLESRLGGVSRLLDSTEALWYRRTFKAIPSSSESTLLNFEAVDYRCEAFVNGKSVGKHQGGNTPFSFDVSDALQVGENELIVRVEDETKGWQLRGKQTLNAHGIWYTQVSGIWQTVWMESVPRTYIADLKIATDANAGTISVSTKLANGQRIADSGTRVRVVVRDVDRVVAKSTSNADSVVLAIPAAKLWSPDSPHLYILDVTLEAVSGGVLDQVQSYAGIRTVSKAKYANGHWRFLLNGQPIFHWGPLDQGWWPDGLLTPPSDEAMLFDIAWLKSAGFNMIRKHIKVESRRYYYHCDRIGMLVWQDQVSGGSSPNWTRLAPDPMDAEWPNAEHEQFMLELERMVSLLENHPSITVWVPFNEAWGQHRTVEVGEWMIKRDPSRTVNIASGGNFWPVGDVVDEHSYPHPHFPFDRAVGGRFDAFIKVIGEFGGHGLPVKDHLWDANRRNWGYGDLPKTNAEYRERYAASIRILNDLRTKSGIAGGVYTQTTDVEGEINGLMTYDRKVIKIPAKDLAEMHQALFSE